MLDQLKQLLGFGPSVDFGSLMNKGAQIIDVRSRGEFSGGHISGSINIPLPEVSNQLHRIRKDKPVIVCCASGVRSGAARRLLKSNGYAEVHNGGGWMSLQRKVQSSKR